MRILSDLAPEARREALVSTAGDLVAAGRDLRTRSPEDIVDLVAAVFESWRDPDSTWRKRLEAELPRAAGFSAANVRRGLTALDGWSGDALRELVNRELGGGRHRTRARGFDFTGVLLAGSIPMPSLLSIVLPLVLGSPVLAKAAARDSVTPALVAASIAAVDPKLGNCVAVVSFGGDDRETAEAFLGLPDCVVATGSDETIAAVSQRVGASQRLVRYGHRLSVAAVGPELESDAVADIAKRLARDASLWDQLGCLSPVAVFAPRSHAPDLAEALARELATSESAWPRGEIDAGAAAAIHRERGEAQMREAAGQGVSVHAGPGTSWTVILEADARWRPAPLHRFVRIQPLDDPGPGALRECLAPVARHLSSVAIEGFGAFEPAVAEALFDIGASRLCRPGSLQTPPLAWRHDGMPLLLPLARMMDLEI